MAVLKFIISTINIALLILMYLFWREERTRSGRYGFIFFMLILAANTALIWM